MDVLDILRTIAFLSQEKVPTAGAYATSAEEAGATPPAPPPLHGDPRLEASASS